MAVLITLRQVIRFLAIKYPLQRNGRPRELAHRETAIEEGRKLGMRESFEEKFRKIRIVAS